MKKQLFLPCVFIILLFNSAFAQNYWQQKAKYKIAVTLNEKDFTLKGKEKITYTNNSPDTLKAIYFHLYFNAFSPNSSMDERSRSIKDPDRRVKDRILHLSSKDIGISRIENLKINGKPVKITTEETIAEIILDDYILPNKKVTITMDFFSQIPKQVRRTGKFNLEDIAITATQWYPKISEYDNEGWHPNPYIGREFYGVWSDFDVKITLPHTFTVAASGNLKNYKEIGHGYTSKYMPPKEKFITWHFLANNVHDFSWAADKDYRHDIYSFDKNLDLHFFYKQNPNLPTDSAKKQFAENWKKLQGLMAKAFTIMNKKVGRYPYKQYSFTQGGDGGMEYAMNTMITGNRNFKSLVGVATHEAIHSWFQHILGTNESKYAWMDEGFTKFMEMYVTSRLFPKDKTFEQLISQNKASLKKLQDYNLEEPLTTHADHFNTNYAYSVGSYIKGSIFLSQLIHILGSMKELENVLQIYFDKWKFKHPKDEDFIRLVEKKYGYVMDWYLTDWVRTTKKIDYAVDSVYSAKKSNQTSITLRRIEQMPMAQKLVVETKDGKKNEYFIPLELMRGTHSHRKETVLKDWHWAKPTYTENIDIPLKNISKIYLDNKWVMDVDSKNDTLKLAK